jgi:hypothetical protein
MTTDRQTLLLLLLFIAALTPHPSLAEPAYSAPAIPGLTASCQLALYESADGKLRSWECDDPADDDDTSGDCCDL